jgi:hypothetical protein
LSRKTGKVIDDQQVVFVELGNSGFESELAAGNLRSLDEIGGAGEQHAPAVLDKSEAESCRKVALAAAGWAKQTANWRRCSTKRRRRRAP